MQRINFSFPLFPAYKYGNTASSSSSSSGSNGGGSHAASAGAATVLRSNEWDAALPEALHYQPPLPLQEGSSTPTPCGSHPATTVTRNDDQREEAERNTTATTSTHPPPYDTLTQLHALLREAPPLMDAVAAAAGGPASLHSRSLTSSVSSFDLAEALEEDLHHHHATMQGHGARTAANSSSIPYLSERVKAGYRYVLKEICVRKARAVVKLVTQRVAAAERRFLSETIQKCVLTCLQRQTHRHHCPQLLHCRGLLHHLRQCTPAVVEWCELDEQDKEWVRLIQRSSAAHQPPELVQYGGSLTCGDLQTLVTPASWLNDQVINSYLDLLCKEGSCTRKNADHEIVSMGTHFYTKALQDLHRGQDGVLLPLLPQSGILRWLRRRLHTLLPYTDRSGDGRSSSSTRLVFVPVNLSNQHWVLTVWDKVEHSWTLYDSLFRSSCEPKSYEVLEGLRHVFAEGYRLLVAEGRDSSSRKSAVDGGGRLDKLLIAQPWHAPSAHRRSSPSSVTCAGHLAAPQQSNGSDCGVYVCVAALCRSQGVAVHFQASEVAIMRTIMGMELWCNRLLVRLPSPSGGLPSSGNRCVTAVANFCDGC